MHLRQVWQLYCVQGANSLNAIQLPDFLLTAWFSLLPAKLQSPLKQRFQIPDPVIDQPAVVILLRQFFGFSGFCAAFVFGGED